MPYGIPLPRFIGFVATSYLMLVAGAQTVHYIYKPLDDLEDLIEAAFQEKLAEKNMGKNAMAENV